MGNRISYRVNNELLTEDLISYGVDNKFIICVFPLWVLTGHRKLLGLL